MKKTIIIGVIIILVGAVYMALKPKEPLLLNAQTLPPQAVLNKFKPEDINFLRKNTVMATTTDEFDNVIQTGIRVPIKYDFPVVTTSGFVVEEIDGFMEMNFGSYNQCRGKGKTRPVCLSEFTDDIESNIITFQINLERELEELKNQAFQDEIRLEDL